VEGKRRRVPNICGISESRRKATTGEKLFVTVFELVKSLLGGTGEITVRMASKESPVRYPRGMVAASGVDLKLSVCECERGWSTLRYVVIDGGGAVWGGGGCTVPYSLLRGCLNNKKEE